MEPERKKTHTSVVQLYIKYINFYLVLHKSKPLPHCLFCLGPFLSFSRTFAIHNPQRPRLRSYSWKAHREHLTLRSDCSAFTRQRPPLPKVLLGADKYKRMRRGEQKPPVVSGRNGTGPRRTWMRGATLTSSCDNPVMPEVSHATVGRAHCAARKTQSKNQKDDMVSQRKRPPKKRTRDRTSPVTLTPHPHEARHIVAVLPVHGLPALVPRARALALALAPRLRVARLVPALAPPARVDLLDPRLLQEGLDVVVLVGLDCGARWRRGHGPRLIFRERDGARRTRRCTYRARAAA